MKYKIKESAEDIKDAVIEKTGHKVHFTMREVEQVQAQNAKTKEEIEAKLSIEQAKMANVLEHHPFVGEATDEQLNAYHIYFGAKQSARVAELKLEEFLKNEKELEEELKDIRKQIPEFAGGVINLSDLNE